MTATTPKIKFDPTDLEGMRKLMTEHGDMDSATFGENANGESVMISIYHDRIVVNTLQHNGWGRTNIYWWDGTTEELFEGKWK